MKSAMGMFQQTGISGQWEKQDGMEENRRQR